MPRSRLDFLDARLTYCVYDGTAFVCLEGVNSRAKLRVRNGRTKIHYLFPLHTHGERKRERERERERGRERERIPAHR